MGNLFECRKENVRGVIGVRVEGGQRGAAVLGLMLGNEAGVIAGESAEVRAGEVHALGVLAAALEQVSGEDAVGTGKVDTLETGHIAHLGGHITTDGHEDRVVDELGTGRGNGGQHGFHVGGVLGNGFLGHDRSTEFGEFVREDLLEGLGVRGTIMDGGGLGDLQEVVRELGHSLALEGIAVGGAQVAGIVGAAVGGGQSRAGVRRGDGGQAGVGDRGDTAHGFVGAAGANQANERGVGGEFGGRSGAAFGGAAGVLGGQQDVMTEQLAALVVNGDFDAALGVFTQGTVGAGEDAPVGDVDGFTGGDLHTAKFVGAFVAGGSRSFDRAFGAAGCEHHAGKNQHG